MIRNLVLLIAVIVTLTACQKEGAKISSRVTDLSSIKYPELKFTLPKPERVVLKNGMVLHFYENHELPIVDIEAMVRVGSAWEPEGKSGLANLMGNVWRSGSTKAIAPEKFDERLEFIGAGIETNVDKKSGTISLSVLKKDLDEGLSLFADLIKNPSFNKKRFAVAKRSMIEGIKRENDDPQKIAARELDKVLFARHKYGSPPTLKSVNALSRADVKQFYYDHVGPESFIVGISGDFDSSEMTARFETLFADFKPAKEKISGFPKTPTDIEGGVFIVNKNRPQTVIRAGHFGISRRNNDYYAVRVMNYMLGGGGFSSRLMKQIRSTKGLAYSVWSYYSGGYEGRGVFLMGGETKAESTHEFLSEAITIMKDIIENGVTKDELAQAKEAIANRFVHAFEKDFKIVSQYTWLEYFDMPEGYLESFRGRIGAVTLSDIKRVAAKYLHPENLVIIAVGDAKKMGEKMDEFGTTKEIKLSE